MSSSAPALPPDTGNSNREDGNSNDINNLMSDVGVDTDNSSSSSNKMRKKSNDSKTEEDTLHKTSSAARKEAASSTPSIFVADAHMHQVIHRTDLCFFTHSFASHRILQHSRFFQRGRFF